MKKIFILFLVIFSVFGSTAQSKLNYDEVIRVEAKTDVVYITDTGTKYHKSSCRTLKKNKYEITKGEAIEQGCTACKVCNPGN